MKTLLNAFGLLAVFAVIPPTLSAQWPPYPTAGVPRTPDGKPNLSAPAPRTPDGKPDLSGIWENPRPPAGQQGGAAAAPGFLSGGPAGPAAAGGPPAPNLFRDAGSVFKDGLPLQPWAADLVKKRMADNSKDNPDAHCLTMGFMQFHNHPQPRKIIQNPGVILIIYEANSGLRQMFTDGRPLPGNDAQPW